MRKGLLCQWKPFQAFHWMLMALDFELESFWSLVLLLWIDASAIFFADREGSPKAWSENEGSVGDHVVFWISLFCLCLDDQRTDQLTPRLSLDQSEGLFEFWVSRSVAGGLSDSLVWKETKSVMCYYKLLMSVIRISDPGHFLVCSWLSALLPSPPVTESPEFLSEILVINILLKLNQIDEVISWPQEWSLKNMEEFKGI